MSLENDARDILDCYLFEDVVNNRNPDENSWDITYVGDDYILRHRDTDEVFNFYVIIGPGTLSPEEIKKAGDEQEWWVDYEDDDDDEPFTDY